MSNLLHIEVNIYVKYSSSIPTWHIFRVTGGTSIPDSIGGWLGDGQIFLLPLPNILNVNQTPEKHFMLRKCSS
jgi:hypothetical protein